MPVCMTPATQAPVNGRKTALLKDCSKVRPTIAASGLPPACLVEAGSRGVGDRLVVAFSTVLARVPAPAASLSDHPVVYDVVLRDIAHCPGVKMSRIRCVMLFKKLPIRPARVQLILRRSPATQRWQKNLNSPKEAHLHVAKPPRGECNSSMIGRSGIDNCSATLIDKLLRWCSNFKTNSKSAEQQISSYPSRVPGLYYSIL